MKTKKCKKNIEKRPSDVIGKPINFVADISSQGSYLLPIAILSVTAAHAASPVMLRVVRIMSKRRSSA